MRISGCGLAALLPLRLGFARVRALRAVAVRSVKWGIFGYFTLET